MRHSLRETRDAYADWISSEPFDVFLTVTAADRTSPEAMLKRTRYILSRWSRHLWGNNAHRKGLKFEGVIGIERTKAGNPHSHSLIRLPDAQAGLPLPLAILQDIASATGGFCKVESPRQQADVASYVAKYVTKEGELYFTPGWTPFRVQRALA